MTDNNFKNIDFEKEHKESVISFGTRLMLKIGDLMAELTGVMSNTTFNNLQNNLKNRGTLPLGGWLAQGMECEILGTDGKGWKKGKVRIKISLEFQPDEPEIEATSENTGYESSLDEIRRKLDGITS
jgi:hypothetical protein